MIRGFLILLLLWLPFCSAGQSTIHTLTGIVHINSGGNYAYKVMFAVKGNKVTGRSITWLPLITTLTTTVTGTINLKDHTLNFVESKIPNSPLRETCYFDVKLKWEPKGDHLLFRGTFIGRDDKDKYCDQGTVTLESSKEDNPLFEIKKPQPKDTVVRGTPRESQRMPKRDTGIMREPDKKPVKVTATAAKDLCWQTDSCIVELWDGEYVDGDSITMLFNGIKVLEHYSLAAAKKRLVLRTVKKANKLSVIAENEGQAPPNTAQIQLTDGDKSYSLLSTLRKGDTATILLNRAIKRKK